MSNPFKKIRTNASESKSTMYDSQIQKEAVVITRDCDTCGAPRPKHTDLAVCSYCKTSFMKTGTVIKSDN